MEKWKREKAFKELQILEGEESRKTKKKERYVLERECRGEIIKMKENAGLELPLSSKNEQ